MDEEYLAARAKPAKPTKKNSLLTVVAFIVCILFALATATGFGIALYLAAPPWALWVYFACLVLFCLAGLWLYRGRRTRQGAELMDELAETKSHIQQIQLQKRQEQLNALQSQINPHFLYNTLDTIRGMALEKDSPEIANIVAALASMFKYSMDYSSTRVTVIDELSHLEQFLKIQTMRFPGKFSFEPIFECEYDTLYKVSIPKMTLQPIVENAISHGLKSRSSEGRITARFILSDYAFSITISDNGVGIDEKTVMALNRSFQANQAGIDGGDIPQFGIALANIDLRTKLYCGESYGLHVTSTQGLGTAVTVTLPSPEEST